MIFDESYYGFKLTPQVEYKHTKYLSTDNAKAYSSNVRKLGKEWEWFGVDIDYKFNKLGYRTKEIEDLKDDYILALGCSYTEGIGLNEEDIYINKLGKYLNLDVFNMGHGGQGIDYCFYNTINYINKMTKKPKLVIYQWPFETRKSFFYVEKITGFLDGLDVLPPNYDSNNPNRSKLLELDDNWYENRFLGDEGEIFKQMFYYIDTVNLLWKSLGVPVFNFHWPSTDPDLTMYNGYMLNKSYPFFLYKIDIDRARDIVHAGKKSHTHLQSCIIKDIIKHNICPIKKIQ